MANFFCIFDIIIFCLVGAIFDVVHNVESIDSLC